MKFALVSALLGLLSAPAFAEIDYFGRCVNGPPRLPTTTEADLRANGLPDRLKKQIETFHQVTCSEKQLFVFETCDDNLAEAAFSYSLLCRGKNDGIKVEAILDTSNGTSFDISSYNVKRLKAGRTGN